MRDTETTELAETAEARAGRVAREFALGRIEATVRASGAVPPEFDVRGMFRTVMSDFKAGSAGYTRVRCAVYMNASTCSVTYNATTQERRSFYFASLAAGSTDERSPEECLAAATTEANPPANASLASAEYEEQGGVKRFAVVWLHYENDVEVEGDEIFALVNGHTGKVFALTRKWRTLDTSYSVR